MFDNASSNKKIRIILQIFKAFFFFFKIIYYFNSHKYKQKEIIFKMIERKILLLTFLEIVSVMDVQIPTTNLRGG